MSTEHRPPHLRTPATVRKRTPFSGLAGGESVCVRRENFAVAAVSCAHYGVQTCHLDDVGRIGWASPAPGEDSESGTILYVPVYPLQHGIGAMPIVSFRSKPAESPPEEYPSAPRVKAQTSNEDIAAAKIAAVARGKKARFEEAEKHYAAQKIQAIQRKHSGWSEPTRADSGKQRYRNGTRSPAMRRQLSRKVSFGSIKFDPLLRERSWTDDLQDAIARCAATLPCWAPPSAHPMAGSEDASSYVSGSSRSPASSFRPGSSAPSTAPPKSSMKSPASSFRSSLRSPAVSDRNRSSPHGLHAGASVVVAPTDADGAAPATLPAAAAAAGPAAAATIAPAASAPSAEPDEDDDEEHDVPVVASRLTDTPVEPAYSGGTSNKQLLSDALFTKVKTLFDKMDIDCNGVITKEEARRFWGTNFAKVNAQAMFNEVDVDGNATITFAEWVGFWENVISSNYEEDDLLDEIEEIIHGGSWVDFDDNRTT